MRAYSILSHNWLAHKINNKKIKEKTPGMKGVIYDLGCGTRPFEEDILEFADQYIGVDWSNTLHGLCADIIADLNESLPIKDSVANNVVSFQVLEHISKPQTMLSEAFRILRENGEIILAVPFQWHEHEVPWDYFRYTKYGLEHLLKTAGFENIEIEALSGFWTMWFLKLNYQLNRLVRGPRLLRWIILFVLTPIWWLNQIIAPVMDQFWPSDGETAWYFATGRKP
jgi:SAM-dependent methyltransferase